ncbi:MAG TPA: hypothetical protein VH394_27495, partial [Thermoanaerobaculia bacterium]|nr:hypothetical protein [Thermoanaerobaculia bacterium]
MEPTPPTPPPPPAPPGPPPPPPYNPGGGGWPPSQPPSTRRFSTGEVLSETFSVFFSSSVPLIITALVMVPFAVIAAFVVSGSSETARKGLESLMNLIQNLVISPLATAAIVYAVFQIMRGRQVEAGDAIRVGFSKLGVVVGVAILQGLATLAGLICF